MGMRSASFCTANHMGSPHKKPCVSSSKCSCTRGRKQGWVILRILSSTVRKKNYHDMMTATAGPGVLNKNAPRLQWHAGAPA